MNSITKLVSFTGAAYRQLLILQEKRHMHACMHAGVALFYQLQKALQAACTKCGGFISGSFVHCARRAWRSCR